MSTNVEILVTGEAAKQQVKAALGASRPAIRFSSSVSSPQRGDPILVAVSSELRSVALHRLIEDTPKLVPFVLLVDALPAFAPALVQLLAHWTARRAQEPFLATSPEVIRRLVMARRQSATKKLIATASIDGDNLAVWSCEPKRYEVPLAEIPTLANMTADDLKDFTIASSGSRIHWDRADVDINLDTVREHADPATRRAHEKKSRSDAARYASAIRKLREERGLSQGEIAGLSERQVRRIESGDSVPQIESLRKLAAAHSMAINDYLGELARRSSSHSRR